MVSEFAHFFNVQRFPTEVYEQHLSSSGTSCTIRVLLTFLCMDVGVEVGVVSCVCVFIAGIDKCISYVSFPNMVSTGDGEY